MSLAVVGTLVACGSGGSSSAPTTIGATPISGGGTVAAPQPGVAEFCAANNALSAVLPSDADPEQIQAVWDQAQPLFQKVVDTAPAEIHDDVVIAINAYQQLLQSVANTVAADGTVPGNVQLASERIDTYITANCPAA
jgi:hypothetical protein